MYNMLHICHDIVSQHVLLMRINILIQLSLQKHQLKHQKYLTTIALTTTLLVFFTWYLLHHNE